MQYIYIYNIQIYLCLIDTYHETMKRKKTRQMWVSLAEATPMFNNKIILSLKPKKTHFLKIIGTENDPFFGA